MGQIDTERQSADEAQGQQTGQRMRSRLALVFCVVVVALLLIPSVGMLWARTDTTTENRELAQLPTFTTSQGTFNQEYLQQLGDWFDDHFAYRNQMVTANALLYAKTLLTSTNSQVLVGTDGWLYYAGTLADWQGTARLSQRGIYNAAHNLALASEHVQQRGGQLLVTVVPDKNTLYGQNMPVRYVQGQGVRDIDALADELQRQGVAYADVYGALSSAAASSQHQLYYARDTHWNNAGAAVGCQALMQALQAPDALQQAYEQIAAAAAAGQLDQQHEGDLDDMLYPAAPTPEGDVEVPRVNAYAFVGEDDVTASTVQTVCPQATGSLYMFRDSFANALIPLLAQNFEQAQFSKLVPYDLSQSDQMQADYVVIERAERHLSSFASDPAVFEAPIRVVAADGTPQPAAAGQQTCSVTATINGPYVEISGQIDPSLLQDRTQVFLTLDTVDGRLPFEACTTCVTDDDGRVVGDNGFVARIYAQRIDQTQLQAGQLADVCVSISNAQGGTTSVFRDSVTVG